MPRSFSSCSNRSWSCSWINVLRWEASVGRNQSLPNWQESKQTHASVSTLPRGARQILHWNTRRLQVTGQKKSKSKSEVVNCILDLENKKQSIRRSFSKWLQVIEQCRPFPLEINSKKETTGLKKDACLTTSRLITESLAEAYHA